MTSPPPFPESNAQCGANRARHPGFLLEATATNDVLMAAAEMMRLAGAEILQASVSSQVRGSMAKKMKPVHPVDPNQTPGRFFKCYRLQLISCSD